MTQDEMALALIQEGHITVIPDTGQIYRHRAGHGYLLKMPKEVKGNLTRDGYLRAGFNLRGNKKYIRLNRLVWIAIHGIPAKGLEVDHINNIKTDNRIANLQLLTRQSNTQKAERDGRRRHIHETKRKIPKGDWPLIYEAHRSGQSQRQIARRYGVTQVAIWRILNGKNKL